MIKRNCCSNVGSNKVLLKFPLSFWSLYNNEWCAATFRNPHATFNPDRAVSTPSRLQIRLSTYFTWGGGAKTIIAPSCASVCSYLRGKKDRQIRYLAPERFTSLRIWNLGVLSYYFLPNTLKHTGIFGHGLHPGLPFFMINRITFFPSSSEKHWYVCSLCRALSSKINISLVVPA